MNDNERFDVTMEELFSLVPIEKIREKDLIHFSFNRK